MENGRSLEGRRWGPELWQWWGGFRWVDESEHHSGGKTGIGKASRGKQVRRYVR